MFSKSTLVGTLVGFVYLFFSGWFFYDYIAADFFSQHQLNSTVDISIDFEAAVVDGVWSMVNFGNAGALNSWIFKGFN